MSKLPIPVGNKILVLPLEKKEEKLESGIVVAASANAELMEGEVVAVSKSLKDFVEVGQVVLYPSRKGAPQLFNGKLYLWLDAAVEREEIWGVKQ